MRGIMARHLPTMGVFLDSGSAFDVRMSVNAVSTISYSDRFSFLTTHAVCRVKIKVTVKTSFVVYLWGNLVL